MQRIINDPNQVVEDMLKGFALAHPRLVAGTKNPRVFRYAQAPVAGKVGIVTGGGSGHKPAFIGYLGRNMVDAVAVGEVFSSPSAQAFYDAFKAADAGKGVACLYGNYAGDNMNVKMAVQLAADDGITVKTVIANDDVPSAPKSEREKRRGVAGEVLMWKVGGARASRGGSLDEVIAAAQTAIDNTRSIGIGLTPCTIPAVGKPNFTIEPGKMEVGIGHHGEPGIKVDTLRPAAEMAEMMLDVILPDLPFSSGDEVVTLVSGLGATPVMELYILYGAVARRLEKSRITVYRPYVGNFFTSLEMMGVTLTLMKLDSELKELIDLETESMGLTQLGGKTAR
jgi:dihydroxyacetone kinase-like protein